MTVLKRVCLDGLVASFRTRIDARQHNESLQWKLHKYIGRPRIVSTNIVSMEIQKSALYQVVVRIKSMQSLERTHENNSASDATEQKTLLEYLVLQKRMLRGEEEVWKIWGTIEETKVEDALGDDALSPAPAIGK